MLYKWLVEVGKVANHYSENITLKKVQVNTKEVSESKEFLNDSQKEVEKLKETIVKKEKIIEELKEDNTNLKNENEKLKTELREFQDQFLGLIKLLENTVNDDNLKLTEI